MTIKHLVDALNYRFRRLAQAPTKAGTDWRSQFDQVNLLMFSETIELRGHIIDSLTLPKVLDQIVTRGATFNIVDFKIGQKRVDPSCARIEITAPTQTALDELVQRLHEQGAQVVNRSGIRKE